jgi:hypothetical protein
MDLVIYRVGINVPALFGLEIRLHKYVVQLLYRQGLNKHESLTFTMQDS